MLTVGKTETLMLSLRKIQRHHTCFHSEGSPCFNVGESVAIVPSAPGGLPEWPKGADCKSAVIDFVGSNPSRSEEHTSELSHVDRSYAVICLKQKTHHD